MSLFSDPFEHFFNDDPWFRGFMSPRLHRHVHRRTRPTQEQLEAKHDGTKHDGTKDDQLVPLGHAMAVPAFDLDLVSKENEYQLNADLPGVKKEDIKIDLHTQPTGEKMLTISADRKDHVAREDKDRGYYSERRSYSKVSRSVGVPSYVRQEDVKADYTDGVLRVTMPRREAEEEKPKATTESVSIK